MPTCFLKRLLPFALTLVMGLLFVKFLGTGSLLQRSVTVHHQLGLADGRGAGGVESDESRAFSSLEVDQKARILSRVNPRYTDEARANLMEGTVVLRAVFSKSGQVENIQVMSGLPYGLTENAIEAASRIKFTPAMKDGRAVSQSVQIDYEFRLD